MSVYFDANATTPLRSQARRVLERALTDFWQNPSSPFRAGGRVQRQLEEARTVAAELLGERGEGSLVILSGATEGHNALFSWAARRAERGVQRRGVLLSAIEHPAALEAAREWFPAEDVRICPVNRQGLVDPEDWAHRLREFRPGLAVLMAANNETGVIQPWREVGEICRQAGVPLHCDAVQLPGKASLEGLAQIPFYLLSGHKFGGPKGIGLLRVPVEENDFHGQRGGEQEGGRRAGTENVPSWLAMVEALKEALAEKETAAQQARYRDAFEEHLEEILPGVQMVGRESPRLANTSFLIMPVGDNLRWVRLLDRAGFAVSTGSACATGKEGPSPVLQAMGYAPEEARRALRISSLPSATEEDWIALAGTMDDLFRRKIKPEEGR